MTFLLRTRLGFESEAFGLEPAVYADRVQALIRTMDRHPHPVVQLYGKIGQLWYRKMHGELDLTELDEPLEAIKAEAWRLIANPAPWPLAQTRCEAYTALLDAIRSLYASDDRAQFALASSRQAVHYLSVCEVQAERGELMINAVLHAKMATANSTVEDHRPRLAAVAERMLDKAGDGNVETFGKDLESIRGYLRTIRNATTSKPPALSTAAGAWKTARKVFDVRQLPGTSQIQCGVVHDGTLYGVGWGPGLDFGRGGAVPKPGVAMR
jgi:hypothetical protein